MYTYAVAAQAPTSERIVDSAMALFAEQGYRATTIVQIEAAAGLTPGAGGIYRHYASKEALLTAGVQRHLGRLAALRDLREVFADVGDLRTQLTITARYLLAEVDSEATLLAVLLRESRERSDLLADAIDQLAGQTIRGFATWLTSQSAALGADRALALATITLGGLLTTRIQHVALGLAPAIDDETLVGVWVDLLLSALDVPIS